VQIKADHCGFAPSFDHARGDPEERSIEVGLREYYLYFIYVLCFFSHLTFLLREFVAFVFFPLLLILPARSRSRTRL
jgi:hypothetical protein